jgi:hypothetical protein
LKHLRQENIDLERRSRAIIVGEDEFAAYEMPRETVLFATGDPFHAHSARSRHLENEELALLLFRVNSDNLSKLDQPTRRSLM